MAEALQRRAGLLGQLRYLLGLALQVAQQMQRTHALAHPALEERLGGAPQVEVGIQLAAEALDVEQGLLQQHQLRLHLHVEAPRGLEQAQQHLAEGDVL
ncbi:hypothetical protein D3C75_1227410 [compost metagenome]